MNDEEMELITNRERPDVAFIRLWTMKEAVLKRAGTGITDNMRTVLADFVGQIETVINEEKNYIYSITK